MAFSVLSPRSRLHDAPALHAIRRGHWLLATCFAGVIVPVAGCGSTPAAGGGSATEDASPTSDATTNESSVSGDDAGLSDVADVVAPMEADVNTAGIDGGPPGLTPTTLDFGSVNCGSPTAAAAQTFTIVNPSLFQVAWTAVLAKGASSAFSLAPAMGSLSPGQSVAVTVTPAPVPQASSTSSNALGDVVEVTLNSSSINVNLKETAQGAVLVFNPTSIPFGSTPLGSPLTTNFEVENVGNLSVGDLTLTLTGDPSFTLSGATPVVVDAGTAPSSSDASEADGAEGDASTSDAASSGAATVDAAATPIEMAMETADAGTSPRSSVTFAPTSTNSVSGSIALGVGAADVLCAPLPTPLNLSGSGTTGKVVVSPTSFVFTPDGKSQSVPCGQTALPATVTIQNIGTALFNWNTTLLHGSGTFYTVTPASGAVSPMSSQMVTITPKGIPATASTIPNAFGDTLTITTNAAMDVPHPISLNETAQGAIISRSTNSLGFGNVASGTTSTVSYTFSNTGNVDATLTLTNGDPAFVQTSPLTVSASAGIFATESVSFQPTTIQSYSDIGLLALQSPVPLCGAFPGNLTLSGTGANPSLAAVPGTLNFGSVPCGSAPMSTQTVNITNNGPATTFTAALLKGAGSYFGVAPMSGNLGAGAMVPLVVTGSMIPAIASTSSNAYGDTLQVTTALNNVVDVNLTMTALGAVLGFSKANVAFATTAPNTPETSPLTVNNTGNLSTNVTLTTTSVFGVTPTAGTVGGGQTLPITASFDPTLATAMSYTGTLSVAVPASTPLCSPLPTPIPLTGAAN
jgi:hypothetical protein